MQTQPKFDESESTRERAVYETPTYHIYGDATELTQGGGGNRPESVGMFYFC
jgi:hypothetical protein